ncbi:hypothetical protein C8R44DRAFT_30753 [Mycena epipterygia]|nr:hypothetical protein C8R44DRAFT_30753 [Mycena epipterygia]
MRFTVPSRARLKPSSKISKPKSRTTGALPDVLWTCVLALKESADAFPPLKSAVGGVVALCNIAEHAKHSKSDARDIALRTKTILDLVADALPDGSEIPPHMLLSIERFTVLLDEIQCRMETIAFAGRVSRVIHLNRNAHVLQDINVQLDDAYRDFAASLLRVEVTQSNTHKTVTEISAEATNSSIQLSDVVFYSRLTVFLAHP